MRPQKYVGAVNPQRGDMPMTSAGIWDITLTSPKEIVCDDKSGKLATVSLDVSLLTDQPRPADYFSRLGKLETQMNILLHLEGEEVGRIWDWIRVAAATFKWPESKN